jgi:ketosteroid isomerase-like protein
MNHMTNSDIQQQLKKLSEDWAAAERQGDAAFFQRTLTDDFVGVGPLGFMLTKTDSVQRFTSGNLKYESFNWEDVKIRLYGDAAVMVGRQTQKAKYQDKVMEGQFRTTLIWVLQQGRWLLAGFHISPIAQGRP